MIKPTIGRVVLYWPPIPEGGTQRDQPLPALVSYVWSDTCINIGGFDGNGIPFHATSVYLLPSDSELRPSSQFAEWMPYQKVQAAKHANDASESSGPVSA